MLKGAHVLKGAHSLRFTSGRGGIAPPECTEVLRTLAQTPQLERQGGNRPLWKRPGRYAPRASAAARAAQAENLPLSQFHMRSTVQVYRAQ